MANTEEGNDNDMPQTSVSVEGARQLATTTKSAPQMQGITSRWLSKILPWVSVKGGTYRLNRVVTTKVKDGRVRFEGRTKLIPDSLSELLILTGFNDLVVLTAMAGRFTQKEFNTGDDIVTQGKTADEMILLAHGKANKLVPGEYDTPAISKRLMRGSFFGDEVLLESRDQWQFTVKATTHCIVLSLSQKDFEDLLKQYPTLREHIDQFKKKPKGDFDRYGQNTIQVATGHKGEPELPTAYLEYDITPEEYELNVAQTVLRIHTRVADLYNDPMNQTEQQIKLVIEQIRERQEEEMFINPKFGLIPRIIKNEQYFPTRYGPPTPDDLDDLLTSRRDPQFLLAQPSAIAAFGRECNKRGLYPQSIEFGGHLVPAWRGIPMLPCSKIPISKEKTTSIIVIRTGEQNEGVIALNQTGIPDEYEPGLNVRFMKIDERAVISYLVSAYFSLVILVPEAAGMLVDVEIGQL